MNPHSHCSGVFHASLHQADIALKELLTILGFAYCTATQQCHGTHRLFGVSSGPTQRLLSQPSPGPVVSGGLASYLQRVHLPAPLIPPEQLQRSGRSVQRSDHFDRMVHQQPRFSGTSRTCGLHAPDRPLCDGSQQTLRSVRFSLSRSPSSGNRRIQPLLGQLGSLYLFPPTPLISKALAKLKQPAFVNALFVCPEQEGRPWYPSLLSLAHRSFRRSYRLQQLVQDSFVVRQGPTRLIAFFYQGTLLQRVPG